MVLVVIEVLYLISIMYLYFAAVVAVTKAEITAGLVLFLQASLMVAFAYLKAINC